jgi:phosphoribosyl-ATP pyrophosphohydrolase
MSKNKIIEETVETIIDNIEEKLVDYMFEYGNYSDSNDIFYKDKEELFNEVVKELNNRITKYKTFNNIK